MSARSLSSRSFGIADDVPFVVGFEGVSVDDDDDDESSCENSDEADGSFLCVFGLSMGFVASETDHFLAAADPTDPPFDDPHPFVDVAVPHPLSDDPLLVFDFESTASDFACVIFRLFS